MELIVLSRRGRIQRAIHLGPRTVLLLGVLFVSGIAAAFWLGQQGAGPAPAVAEDVRTDLMVAAMRAMVLEQRQAVEAAKAGAEHDLDALAQQLGELRARAIRIDALGERLVDMVGLDPGEFGFGAPPGQGGPAPTDSGHQTQAAELVGDLAALSSRLADRAQELEALERSIIDVRTAQQMHPQGRPVSIGWISSVFGWRSDPVTGRKSFHEGLDFAGKPGSPIFAAASGIVSFSGVRRGFGNVVEVEHGAGYVTRYAHNKKNLVERGARVAKGQKIALMGSSGRATGTHLHFEVLKDDKALNPMTFMRAQQERRKPGAADTAAADTPES